MPEPEINEINEQHENIKNTLRGLAKDLDAIGWDQPARIYHLTEDENDPIAVLAGVMPTYPPDDMKAAFESGVRVPPHVLGLLVASEGYRHLHIDEVLERNALMRSRILDKVRETFGTVDEERADELIAKYYNETLVPNLPGPSQMPPFMRAEMRTLCAVLRDGTTVTYGHTRDKDDASVEILPEESLKTTNIPKAMYLFIHDLLPDIECPDPKQRVADHEALKFLSNLPTTEDPS